MRRCSCQKGKETTGPGGGVSSVPFRVLVGGGSVAGAQQGDSNNLPRWREQHVAVEESKLQ